MTSKQERAQGSKEFSKSKTDISKVQNGSKEDKIFLQKCKPMIHNKILIEF